MVCFLLPQINKCNTTLSWDKLIDKNILYDGNGYLNSLVSFVIDRITNIEVFYILSYPILMTHEVNGISQG